MNRPGIRRWLAGAVAILVLAVLGAASASAPARATTLDVDVEIGPALAELLGSADPGERIEAVVTFEQRPSADDLAAVAATGVATHTFDVLPMVGVRGTADQIRRLADLPGVRSVYHNRKLEYYLDESVHLIGADRVWNDLGFTGEGITIAVLDSGIDATHPDLPFGDKVVQNVKIAPDLFGDGPVVIENLVNTDTSSGHGTHVASTIAGTGAALSGKYRGVATGADLVGIGAGDALFILAALEGFDYILEHQDTYGIQVISNSWGTTGEFSPSDPINIASKMAYEAGMVVVFAAGNEGPDPNTLNPYSVAPWVIGVAAGDKDGQTLADFSSRGVPGDDLYHPDITAPGVNIAAARATTGAAINAFLALDVLDIGTDAAFYAVASGTSMATPHVSGVAALMLEANPGLHPDLVSYALVTTAREMPGYQEYEVGAGYVDAYAAVRNAQRMGQRKGTYTDPKTGKTYETYTETVTWTGQVGPATDIVLTTVESTDERTFEILADAVGATVTIQWDQPGTDLDLYVYGPDGTLVGSSTQFLATTEEAAFTAGQLGERFLPHGGYRVVVDAYTNVLQSYSGSFTVEYVLR